MFMVTSANIATVIGNNLRYFSIRLVLFILKGMKNGLSLNYN